MQKPITLGELNTLVRDTLACAMPDEYWVQAELSEVRTAANGHCYVEFVQKNPHTNALVAKARGNIWRNVWQLLEPAFERETGQRFVAGLKVLVLVSVQFHELYGFSLTVLDIDPTYTMGDLARRRKEILQQLDDEGVLTLNKELELPALVQRIAVISSAGAAGYGDFCNQLQANREGFAFYPHLFPAVMQGEQVEPSIIAALDTIAAQRDCWDVVVIIRGGGATSDLTGFDTYPLAANCAQFPLPIITGIGHERDDTVLDLVAHTRVKTPTAAAEFIIGLAQEAAEALDNLSTRLSQALAARMTAETHRLEQLAGKLPTLFSFARLREEQKIAAAFLRLTSGIDRLTQRGQQRLDTFQQQFTLHIRTRLLREEHRLQLLAQRAHSADPERLLARGYSITLHDGRVVKDPSDLAVGDEVETRVEKGKIRSIVKNTSPNSSQKGKCLAGCSPSEKS